MTLVKKDSNVRKLLKVGHEFFFFDRDQILGSLKKGCLTIFIPCRFEKNGFKTFTVVLGVCCLFDTAYSFQKTIL